MVLTTTTLAKMAHVTYLLLIAPSVLGTFLGKTGGSTEEKRQTATSVVKPNLLSGLPCFSLSLSLLLHLPIGFSCNLK